MACQETRSVSNYGFTVEGSATLTAIVKFDMWIFKFVY